LSLSHLCSFQEIATITRQSIISFLSASSKYFFSVPRVGQNLRLCQSSKISTLMSLISGKVAGCLSEILDSSLGNLISIVSVSLIVKVFVSVSLALAIRKPRKSKIIERMIITSLSCHLLILPHSLVFMLVLFRLHAVSWNWIIYSNNLHI